jgi:hypothetical protein
MKKIVATLLLTIAGVQGMDTKPSQPSWISIKHDDTQEFFGQVDREVQQDKQLRRGVKDLEFLRNVMVFKYNIEPNAIDTLVPWISRPVDRQNLWGTKYLAVDFADVAPLIAVKLGGQHTGDSILQDIMSLYKQAKMDRKKRQELVLIGHVLQSDLPQDHSLNFASLKEMWFEAKRENGMMNSQAYMSSQPIVDVYNSSLTPSSEQPIKVDLSDVYNLFSRRFGVDYAGKVGELKSALKKFKTEQRYLTAAHRVLKTLDSTNMQLMSMQDSVAPQQYQSIAFLLGAGSFFKSELKEMLPNLYVELHEKKTLSLLSGIVGDQYSTDGKFILKAQNSSPESNSSNIADLGDPQTLIHMREGQLYRGNSVIADDMTHNLIYAVDRLGNLCVQVSGSSTTPNHDRFFTVNGVGQPIACGGHISIQRGKVMKIDPMSGHYMPAILQLFLVVKYLNDKGVIDPKCVVTSYELGDFSLKEVLSITDRIELKA